MRTRSPANRNGGFATLIVMMVAAMMVTYVLVNTRTLGGVKTTLQLIEKKQLRKFEGPAKTVRQTESAQ